jgi:predicted ATPase/DNA-binding winged helix-turn-helix (wHTH) protein/Tfp pilus assembly protein PilF
MVLTLEDCQINLASRSITRGDSAKRLTGTEVELLRYLSARPHEVVPRDELYREVWGHRADLLTRTLDLAVYRLRKKIERDASNPIHVMSVYGRGYTFVPMGESAEDVRPASASETQKAKTNLTREENRFFGRVEESNALNRLMASRSGFITVLGPPGTGKTRFTKHWAAEYLESGEVSSAWFCNLTEARTRQGMLQAVASTLEVSLPTNEEDPEALERLVGHAINALGSTVLLVDNAEQVAQWAGPVLENWWKAADQARFVVTSQVALGVAMEQRMPLSPLPKPSSEGEDAHCPAVQLFVDRARSVQPAFARTQGNQADIAAIVTALDGLPLAIELAAARVHLMPPAVLRERLSNRFRLLKRPKQAGPARHQTLQAALDWSWDLLEPWEKAALAQCHVFHGGFDWEAVEAVVDVSAWPQAPWSIDVVANLVDRSLVMVEENREGLARLSLLTSIAEYACGRAAEFEESDVVEAPLRHARYFSRLGRHEYIQSLCIHGGVARRWRLIRDLENLRAGFETSMMANEGETAALCGLAAAQVLQVQGPVSDGIALMERVAQTELAVAERTRVHQKFAFLLFVAGRDSEARHQNERALTLSRESGNRRGEGIALANISDILSRNGRFEDALAHCQESLAIAREVGNRVSEGASLGNLGEVYRKIGQISEALEYNRKALSIHLEMGNRRSEAIILGNTGIVLRNLGRHAEALEHYQQALSIHREVGNLRFEGKAWAYIGVVHLNQAEYGEATECFQAALAIVRKIGSRGEEGMTLGYLGIASLARGDLDTAGDQLRQCIAIMEDLQIVFVSSFQSYLARVCAEQGELDEARDILDTAEATVRDGDTSQVLLADVLSSRVRVELLSGDKAAARDVLEEVCSIAETLKIEPDSEPSRNIAELQALLEEPK